MEKNWYVLQTLVGQEKKAKDFMTSEVKLQDLDEYFGQIAMPTEETYTIKDGKKRRTVRKVYPGYLFVEVALYNDDGTMNGRVYSMIQSVQGVIGFLGGIRPVPMTTKEVDGLKAYLETAETKSEPKPKVTYQPGEVVRIILGAFENFTGTVEEVDPERGKLKVSVAIFGRSAPVELEYWQVERHTGDDVAAPAL